MVAASFTFFYLKEGSAYLRTNLSEQENRFNKEQFLLLLLFLYQASARKNPQMLREIFASSNL